MPRIVQMGGVAIADPKDAAGTPSVSGVARISGRQAAAAAGIGRGVAVADIIGIGDAPQAAPGSCGLTLLIAREGAVAQARLFVALNAKRIWCADRFGRRGAECCETTGGQQR